MAGALKCSDAVSFNAFFVTRSWGDFLYLDDELRRSLEGERRAAEAARASSDEAPRRLAVGCRLLASLVLVWPVCTRDRAPRANFPVSVVDLSGRV